MPESPIIESRSWHVECRRRIIVECERVRSVTTDELRADGETVGSLRDAERILRDEGWTLHGDGTASCPACLDAWEGRLELTFRASTDLKLADDDDPDEIDDLLERLRVWHPAPADPEPVDTLEDAIVVDPAEGNVR